MSKAPAFQFYPGDWMQDTRVLSLAAKGAWIDLLCAMWRSQTRGKLSLSWVGYARLIGASVEQTKAVINELIDMQICDYGTDGNADCNGNVTVINRRMAREEKERESTRYRVERHRNADMKRKCNADCNGNVTVPSSTSSSSSLQKKENIKRKKTPSPGGDYTPSFNEFWNQYPNKTGKGEAFRKWEKLKPHLHDVLKAIKQQKEARQWKEGFIPNPATWLHQRRWEDEGLENNTHPDTPHAMDEIEMAARGLI